MGKAVKVFIIIFLVLYILPDTQAQDDKKEWWNSGGWQRPVENPQAKILPKIMVKGNKFVNENGDTILFRGLAVSDPDKLADQGYWTKAHFEKVKEMGAMIVRLPVHPVAWRDRTPEGYMELLDKAVAWCTELEMYIIIDWHSIGNLVMELFQNPMYETSKKETYDFWRAIAGRFRGHNTVAFYEIFNEPTMFRGLLGSMTWPEWKKINEDIIRLIRAYDKETIPLVAGFDWAYDLNHIRYNPVNAVGIGYVSHPYPMKRRPPWEDKWEENFAFAAWNYPVIATELGFGFEADGATERDRYGERIVNFLEERGISWVAWVFDPDWYPSFIKSFDGYELTEPGLFFKKALNGEVQK